MIEITISAVDLGLLRTRLLDKDEERCATLFANEYRRADGVVRLLVRDVAFPEDTDYLVQSKCKAQLTGAYVAKVTQQAIRRGEALVFVHTHVQDTVPNFSAMDDQGEVQIKEFLDRRHPMATHAALVMSPGGMQARRLGSHELVRVVSLGSHRDVLTDPTDDRLFEAPRYDRHVRAFGERGQRQIQTLRVAIVGLGGTGSILAQQLGHLGVQQFLLIDPDVVDETNLNRVVGANGADIGSLKIDLAKRQLLAHNESIVVNCLSENIVRASVANALSDVDVIFSCTDSHGSRSVIQQMAYQYLIPCIDMGSVITIDEERIAGIFGRVQLLSPGEPCLWCSNLLDSEEIRRDLMTDNERRLDPYIPGADIPTPSVIWLNGIVVSLAVGMFMSLITGSPMRGRHWQYHAHRTTLRNLEFEARKDCFICSKQGVLGKGKGHPLYARED